MRKVFFGVLVLLLLGWSGVAWADTTYNTPAVTIMGSAPYRVDISWEPVSNIPEAVYGTVTGYDVCRCLPSSPHLFQRLETVSAGVYAFSDNTVTPEHSYIYVAWPAYSAQIQPNFNLIRSSVVTAPASSTGLPNPNAKIVPVDDYSPYTPQITIEGAYSDHVNISWVPFTGVSEQVYGALEYYEVRRGTPDYPNYGIVLGSADPNVYNYSDTTVVPGEQYIYSVRPMFSEEHNQPLLNIQGSIIVVIPNSSSSSVSSSGSSSSGTALVATSEIQPTTVQEPVALLASAVTNQPVIQYFYVGPKILLNGQPINFDVQPEIKNDRTFAPVRTLAYSLGVPEDGVSWDGTTNTVTINKSDLTLKLTIGSSIITVNGEPREMDVAPYIKDDRTMFPIRFIAEALGATVEWDEKTQKVIIRQGS